MAVNNAVLKGLTTAQWGPRGMMTTPAVVVQSIQVTPKYPGPVGEVEDGDGAGVLLAMLDDGFNARVTYIADKAVDDPAVGAAVTLNLVALGTKDAGGALKAYACHNTSVPEEGVNAKGAVTKTINLVYRPGITAS